MRSLKSPDNRNMESWLLLVFYMSFICSYVCMERSTNFSQEMSNLREICPYSSFCEEIAPSDDFPYSDNYRPCCESCSCNADCGLRGDCCFGQSGAYNNGEIYTTCRNSFAIQTQKNIGMMGKILKSVPYFRMIDKCGAHNAMSRASEITCELNSSDVKGTINPVVSPSTGHVYINAFCALCNNASDTIPWEKAIMCPLYSESSLSDFILNSENGKPSGCFLYYSPPANVSLAAKPCYQNVIRQCNSTGGMKIRKPFWDFCETFNATFTAEQFRQIQAFANVYCFMCNMNVDAERIGEIMEKMQCKKQTSDIEKVNVSSFFPLTITLDTSSVEQTSAVSGTDETKNCQPHGVMVASLNSQTISCREVKCPMGQLLINNKCDYYSKKWIGGPFSVVFRLSKLSKDMYLPTSFFTHMPAQDKSDRVAKWLRRKTLRRWFFYVLYHPSEDLSSVEYIIAKASYPSRSVDPHILKLSVKKALQDVWTIVHNSTVLSFKVELNDYSSYDPVEKGLMLSMGISVSFGMGYFPSWVICLNPTSGNNYYELMVYPVTPVSSLNRFDFQLGVWITKLFFCDQIDLLPDEYDYSNCSTLFFKVKNKTISTFSTINLPDTVTTPSVPSDSPGGISVRVCLHEFDQNSVNIMHMSVLRTVVIISMCLFLYLL